MINAVKNCHSVGIHANCTRIMGYPGETLSELKTSVAFIKWQEEFVSSGKTSGSVEYNNVID